MTGHEDAVLAVAFNRTVASADEAGSIRLWDWVAHTPIGTLVGHTGPVRALAFSLDGRKLISAGSDRTVQVWDVPTRKTDGEPMIGHGDDILGLALAPNGRTIATGDAADVLRFWDLQTHAAVGAPVTLPHAKGITGVAFSPDGCGVAAVGFVATVSILPVPRA